MSDEKGITRFVWPVIAILALVLIVMTLFGLSMIEYIMNISLELSGSSVTVESSDKGVVSFIRILLAGSLWHGIWFGIFGLFCAWGIRRKERFAWKLGVLWSVMLIAHGIIIAVNELFVARWPTTCTQVPEFIIVGVIALVCLLVIRKEFA